MGPRSLFSILNLASLEFAPRYSRFKRRVATRPGGLGFQQRRRDDSKVPRARRGHGVLSRPAGCTLAWLHHGGAARRSSPAIRRSAGVRNLEEHPLPPRQRGHSRTPLWRQWPIQQIPLPSPVGPQQRASAFFSIGGHQPCRLLRNARAATAVVWSMHQAAAQIVVRGARHDSSRPADLGRCQASRTVTSRMGTTYATCCQPALMPLPIHGDRPVYCAAWRRHVARIGRHALTAASH